MTQCKQNFPDVCEAGLNKQVNIHFNASYVYSSVAFHFDRDDVALPGFHKYFMKLTHKHREFVDHLSKFQNTRGGRLFLQELSKPSKDDWGSGLEALQVALELEKKVNESLLELHSSAESMHDEVTCELLEDHFMGTQVEAIKELSDFITECQRSGPGLGEYIFDRKLSHD